MRLCEFAIVSLVLVLTHSSAVWAGTKLITEEEASRPPPKGAVAADRRGVLRGPKLDLILPDSAMHSPIHLQIKFVSFGDTKIDPDSITATYLRTPNVDLTDRIKRFATAEGIDMPDAEVPPGEHIIRVDIRDTAGHPGSASYILKVLP
ncbi:hypothetical protein [Bradyrhizobium japonicum]|uniref:hypothetical protein n=1 Tax=Bradyrhizobium japonicum TaxID=375 RepID=UPI0027145817|nr:hypothetical protein [Bradyrhizobium japonicum]WLB24197.1 hypothetical protein QIH95_47350 [Bradyrhizobium japonicum]